jgi:hypothetical protein
MAGHRTSFTLNISYDMGFTENAARPTVLIFACVLVAAGTCLPNRYPAAMGWGNADTQHRGDFISLLSFSHAVGTLNAIHTVGTHVRHNNKQTSDNMVSRIYKFGNYGNERTGNLP